VKAREASIASPMPERDAIYYPWTFYEETPALVRPVFASSDEKPQADTSVRAVGFLIIELNGSFLRRVYLPELADRHFGQLDFEIAVRTAKPPYQPVYASTTNFPVAI